MILLKEFVQAKAELKSFAVNEIEGLVRREWERKERGRGSAEKTEGNR